MHDEIHHDQSEEERLARRQAKKEEHVAEHQRHLDWCLRDSEVDWEFVRSLLGIEGLKINYTEVSTHITTLHRAAYAGEAQIVLWCIKEKADVNVRSNLGRSPLHFACDGNRPRCIKLLLEHKADGNIRTLSYLTPLHICCQNNLQEAAMALLGETNQVIDIDAIDNKSRLAEALTSDKKILKAIRKYRISLDERRKAQLLEQCLRRLFCFFDVNNDGWIHPEEWLDTMTVLAEFFEHHCDDSIDKMFRSIDKDHNGYIDWEEFKAAHVDLLSVLGVPFRRLMDSLCDLERAIFREQLFANAQLAVKEAKAAAQAAHVEAEAAASKQPILELELDNVEASSIDYVAAANVAARHAAKAEAAAESVHTATTNSRAADAASCALKEAEAAASVSSTAQAAAAVVRFRAPVISPKAKAMSLRRAAIRRVSEPSPTEDEDSSPQSFTVISQTSVSNAGVADAAAEDSKDDVQVDFLTLPPIQTLPTDEHVLMFLATQQL